MAVHRDCGNREDLHQEARVTTSNAVARARFFTLPSGDRDLALHMPEFLDENADVFAVIDRNRDQVQAASGKCLFQRRRQA